MEPPTFAAKDLHMLTFVTLPKLGTKRPRVWVSGLLLHMPRTPTHRLLPSPKLKSMPLLNAFKRASPPLGCETRATTLAIFAVRKDTKPMNVLTGLTLLQSLALTPPNPMDSLQDLHNVLDVETHAATVDTTKKGKEDSKQTSKVGNIFLQQALSPPCLSLDIPFIGAPSACLPT